MKAAPVWRVNRLETITRVLILALSPILVVGVAVLVAYAIGRAVGACY